MPDPKIRPRWTTSTKLLVNLALFAMVVYLLARFRTMIPLLILASVLAYVLSPLVSRIEKRVRLNRWLATLVVYLCLIGVMAIIPALIIPLLVDRITQLDIAFQEIFTTLESLLGRRLVIGEFTLDSAEILTQVVATVRDLIEPLFGRTVNLAVNVISSVVSGGFVLVISFYLVKDHETFRTWLLSLPPPSYREDFRRLLVEINAIWQAFFRGQVILALIVSIGFTLVGYALGLPFALALGLFAGLMEFVPSIGHTIWITIASFLAFFLGSTWLPVPNWLLLVILLGLYLLFAQFDVNYLIPRVIGQRVQLHPLVVILGIIAGASVAGVLGVILAAPTIASARVLGRYVFANLVDEDPFVGDLSQGAQG